MSENKSTLLSAALTQVSASDQKLGLRLRKLADTSGPVYRERAEDFFLRYRRFIQGQGRDFSFGVDCFLALQRTVEEQRAQFLRTGRYANTSFEDVNRAVYSNPEVMQHHMHGLVFAQFFWLDQYRRFEFFCERLPQYAAGIRHYLEIGGGHALYVSHAARTLAVEASIEVVDISATSLEMAQQIAPGPRIQYHLKDVFDFHGEQYDFVTMGEVLEHVERPQELLEKLRTLLKPEGRAYITTPANAPMIDHIYLFRNAEEIRAMLTSCGFRIEFESKRHAVDIDEALAQRMKLPLMYAAFVSRT